MVGELSANKAEAAAEKAAAWKKPGQVSPGRRMLVDNIAEMNNNIAEMNKTNLEAGE